MNRILLTCVLGTLVVGLCQCSILFDLSALDQPGARNNPSGDGGDDNDSDGDDALTSPDTGPDAPAADVGMSVIDATSEDEATLEEVNDSSPSAADSVAPVSDATDAGADVTASKLDASRDAPADVVHDALAEVAPPFDPSKCPSVLLSPSANVVASYQRFANYANQAVDKNFTTRWESLQQADEPPGVTLAPQWIYLDFLAPVSITRVRIDWQNSCAQAYELQVSNDAASWVTLVNGAVINSLMKGTQLAPTDWSTDVDTTNLSGVGRYLRVYATQRCQPLYGYSIWEMEVYGHGAVSGCAQGM